MLSLLPGAGGKCLLAFMAPTERTGALTRAVAAARERGYVIDETALQAELDAGRRCGYLASREERVPGGSGLSFPLRSAGGTQVGALSLSSLVDRLTGEHRERCVEAGLRQAAAIERLLGYERVDGR
ncbi:MAG: IclR family transcriptional regulator C-terminal domain-containing protein [Solirubrobacterales bacterium]